MLDPFDKRPQFKTVAPSAVTNSVTDHKAKEGPERSSYSPKTTQLEPSSTSLEEEASSALLYDLTETEFYTP